MFCGSFNVDLTMGRQQSSCLNVKYSQFGSLII